MYPQKSSIHPASRLPGSKVVVNLRQHKGEIGIFLNRPTWSAVGRTCPYNLTRKSNKLMIKYSVMGFLAFSRYEKSSVIYTILHQTL